MPTRIAAADEPAIEDVSYDLEPSAFEDPPVNTSPDERSATQTYSSEMPREAGPRREQRQHVAVGGLVVAISAVMVMVSCSASNARHATTTSVATTSAASTSSTISHLPTGNFTNLPLGRTGCSPASPIVGSEVRGSSSSGEVWGLLFNDLVANADVKIAWRLTGTGDLDVSAESPSGAFRAPTWGPESHGGSNWARPGAEWGTGFVFDQPGCWHLRLDRSDVHGDVWLQITQ